MAKEGKQQKKVDPSYKKAAKWLKELSFVQEHRKQLEFERQGEKIVKNYLNQSSVQNSTSSADNRPSRQRVLYNVLWSNVQVQQPLLYARTPKVVVERRHKDSDPIGRLACKIAERSGSFLLSSQQERFDFVMSSVVQDRLLPGRGVAWVRYDSDIGTDQDNDKVSGQEVSEGADDAVVTDAGGEGAQGVEGEAIQPQEAVLPNSERVIWDYVHWLDFFHSQARNWYEVRWVAKRAYMTRSELIERFGEELGNLVELTGTPTAKSKKRLSQEDQQFLLQGEVFELWDLESKTVYWVSPGYPDGLLDEKPDPLHLEGFFPCPKPLLATTSTDSLYPTPDYKIYEGLAEELDKVTARIVSIVECIRVVGAYAAGLADKMKNILDLRDGSLTPIEGWQAFANEKGGIGGAINWYPFDNAVAALPQLWQHKANLQADIDEITGIPDIVRGSSDPSETASAVQRKSKWTMLKAVVKQSDVQRFGRDLLSKAVQIIFEPGLFADDTIALMSGADMFSPEEQANYPEALNLLRSDRLRTFKIDIETDSMLAQDEDEDQAARMAYIQAVTQLTGSIQNVAQFRPELMNPMIQSALFAVRAFRTGRDLEGSWERAMKEIEDADAQAKLNPPQPPPDPTMMQIQVEQQRVQQEGQLKAQELQLKAQDLQQSFELESQKLNIEAQKVMSKQQIDQMDQELQQFQEQFRQYVETQRLELEKYATVLTEREKILEEDRLKHEQTLEAIRMVHEKVAESGASAAKEPAKPPVIHIHNGAGAKEVVMQRLPTGELVGRSREVPSA